MSPGALATESAHCATRTAKTSAKSLPRRKTRKAPQDEEGQKDNSLRETYADLKYYMAGFNKQMRLAAYETKPAAFNQANRKYKNGGLTTNPYQGIVVWHLIHFHYSQNEIRLYVSSRAQD